MPPAPFTRAITPARAGLWVKDPASRPAASRDDRPMSRARPTTSPVEATITRATRRFFRMPWRSKEFQKLWALERPMAYTNTARPSR